MRLGGSQRSVTLTTVGLAWRTALLIASWAKRSSSCCILGGKLSSGMFSDRKSQRNRPATFECSTKRCNVEAYSKGFVRFRQLGGALLREQLPFACHGRSHCLRALQTGD